MGTKENDRPVVLVVDDKREIREFADNHFRMIHGYQVITAATYEGAVRAIHSIKRKMIVAFVDINLQDEQSGLDLLRYIEEYASHRVVPFGFTGEHSIMLEKKAADAGALQVFRKGEEYVWDRMLIYTEAKQVARLVRGRAEDPITGLDDFSTFRKSAIAEMKTARTRKGRKDPDVFSLLFLDMDEFKSINDTFGNLVGDQALQKVAEVLRTHLRPMDHVCRKGGDEFLVWLPDVELPQAILVGDKLKGSIAEADFETQDGRTVHMSVSFGASQVSRDEIEEDVGKTLDILIDKANQREVEDKETSRNSKR